MDVNSKNSDNCQYHHHMNCVIYNFKSAIAKAKIIENQSDLTIKIKQVNFEVDQLSKEYKRAAELRDSFKKKIKQLKSDIVRLQGGQPEGSDPNHRLADNSSPPVIYSSPFKSHANGSVQNLSSTTGSIRQLQHSNWDKKTSPQLFFLALQNRAANVISDLRQQFHRLKSRREELAIENKRIYEDNNQLDAKQKYLVAFKHYLESEALKNIQTQLVSVSPKLSGNFNQGHYYRVSSGYTSLGCRYFVVVSDVLQ